MVRRGHPLGGGMIDDVLIVGAAAIGLVAGYLLAYRRARAAVAEELQRAERRAAQAIKTARDELASDLDRKDHAIATLEARFDEVHQKGDQARSRLQADLAHAQTERSRFEAQAQAERVRFEARVQELAQQVEMLSAEVRQANEEGMRELEVLHEIGNALDQAIQRMEARLLAVARRVKESVVAATKS